MRKLAAVLRKTGHNVVETREPGGTATGEKIRKIVLDSGTSELAALAEMALMFAARAQHIAEVIEPGLAAGAIVLCDRFTDSTEAYQGSGRRLGSESVRELHRVLCRDLQRGVEDFSWGRGGVDRDRDVRICCETFQSERKKADYSQNSGDFHSLMAPRLFDRFPQRQNYEL